MKSVTFFLCIALCLALYTCSVTKNVDKAKSEITKIDKSDSAHVSIEHTNVREFKTDSSIIVTIEHITNSYSHDSLTIQVIDRKIIETKKVNVVRDSLIIKRDSTYRRNDIIVNERQTNVTKYVKREGFAPPWWAWVLVSCLLAMFVFFRFKK